MRWCALLVVAAGCKSGKDSAPAPAPAPVKDAARADAIAQADAALADAPISDAAVDTALPAAPHRRGAVDLGKVGPADRYAGVHSLLLSGSDLYYSTADDTTVTVTFHRVRRTGGEHETIATSPAIDASHAERNLAVIGDDVFVNGMTDATKGAEDSRAPLYRVEHGKPVRFARGPTATIVSTGLIAYDNTLYWIAAGTTGDGPIMATTPSGDTKMVAHCPKPAIDDCPDLLDGPRPIIADDDKLVQLGPHEVTLAARCPCGSLPTRIVGEYVLCRSFDTRADAPCKPAPELVKLDGSEHVMVKELGTDVTLAGRYYYHTVKGVLFRRKSLTGRDEVFAHASLFTADDRGVAWVDGDHLWTAPH
jgi:hypothetical protein